ncbi:MAG: FAD-dependent oxidoreductase, partial [Bacteroidia bacterium]|nr:FAD-dependent oxidoreductase [Bacteroidia bacterium]
NRRYDFMPTLIILCESSEQISVAIIFCDKNKLPIRVRSGGHDHEGECSATQTILLDLSKMKKVEIDIEKGLARIEPGIVFQELTTILADKDVMIPHGTCGTVGIAGFTLGGGWGPWTRKHGMCCESLVEATMVLGDGSIVKVTQDDKKNDKGLLWAIKGGGGFSYGIVTEFVLKTFELPAELIKFQIEWNKLGYAEKTKLFKLNRPTPTIKILKAWEKTIGTVDASTIGLVGTNLMVMARADGGKKINTNTVSNSCTMYGYWEGEEKELKEFVKKHFAGTGQYTFTNLGTGGRNHKDVKYGDNLMSNWDRVSHHNVLRLMKGLEGTPFPADKDAPGPHKITCRLTNAKGLQAQGHKQLLNSLSSSLIYDDNIALGLTSYITLGAITGKFYKKDITAKEKEKSSFPYKDRLFTIQYQTWWNEPTDEKEKEKEKEEGNNNPVYNRVNRALDWMEVCRDYDIPNTSGSFISFKDSSVPTKTYFDKSYNDLVTAKEKHSKDPLNHFRSRKTII